LKEHSRLPFVDGHHSWAGMADQTRKSKQVHKHTYMAMRTQAPFVMLGLMGALLVLLSTSRYGVGMSEDSVAYTSCARNLMSGDGYTCHYSCQDSTAFVLWPPLFPTLLAALGKAGIAPLVGARFLNAIVFGLIVFASGQLFRMHMRSTALAILATTSVLLSVSLLNVSVFAWTEPLFTLLTILFAMHLGHHVRMVTQPVLRQYNGCCARYEERRACEMPEYAYLSKTQC